MEVERSARFRDLRTLENGGHVISVEDVYQVISLLGNNIFRLDDISNENSKHNYRVEILGVKYANAILNKLNLIYGSGAIIYELKPFNNCNVQVYVVDSGELRTVYILLLEENIYYSALSTDRTNNLTGSISIYTKDSLEVVFKGVVFEPNIYKIYNFINYDNGITSLKIEDTDFSDIHILESFISDCRKLKSVDIDFGGLKVEEIDRFLYDVQNIEYLRLKNIDLSNIKTFKNIGPSSITGFGYSIIGDHFNCERKSDRLEVIMDEQDLSSAYDNLIRCLGMNTIEYDKKVYTENTIKEIGPLENNDIDSLIDKYSLSYGLEYLMIPFIKYVDEENKENKVEVLYYLASSIKENGYTFKNAKLIPGYMVKGPKLSY